MSGSSTPPTRHQDASDRAGSFPAEDVLYRAVFESAVDFAMVVTDLHGRIIAWNVGVERVLGWSSAEMLREPIDRFFTP